MRHPTLFLVDLQPWSLPQTAWHRAEHPLAHLSADLDTALLRVLSEPRNTPLPFVVQFWEIDVGKEGRQPTSRRRPCFC
jgi:hypothetical protein